jgi:hypothetical protein
MPKPTVGFSQSKPLSVFRLKGVHGNVAITPDSFVLGLIKKALKIPMIKEVTR